MIYLQLYHGRKTVKEDMNGWGTKGPVLGPWLAVQWTYGTIMRLLESDTTCPEYWLSDNPGFEEGLIYYNGVYYGDFCLVSETDPIASKAVRFNPKLAVLPNKRKKHGKLHTGDRRSAHK